MNAAVVKKLVRGLVSSESIDLVYVGHAKERMFQRDIDLHDVLTVLKAGAVISNPIYNLGRDNYEVTFEGADLNGRSLMVAVAVRREDDTHSNRVRLITVAVRD